MGFRPWQGLQEAVETKFSDILHSYAVWLCADRVLRSIATSTQFARVSLETGLMTNPSRSESLQRLSIAESENDSTAITTGFGPCLGRSLIARDRTQQELSPITHPTIIKLYSTDAAALMPVSTLCTMSHLNPRAFIIFLRIKQEPTSRSTTKAIFESQVIKNFQNHSDTQVLVAISFPSSFFCARPIL